jgi:hypothetical protein
VDIGQAFRRCIIDLDVIGVRRIWRLVAPGMPQLETDEETLHALHLARTKARFVPAKYRDYSQAWLDERQRKIVAHAVGVAVGIQDARYTEANMEMAAEMSGAVSNAHQEGVPLHEDAAEVTRRMRRVRAMLKARRAAVRGFRFNGS